MLKLFGALILFAACVLLGFFYAERLRLRKNFLNAFISFLTDLRTRLRYESSDIKDLIFVCSYEKELSAIHSCFGKECSGTVEKIWEEACAVCKNEFSLNSEDLKVLTGFGSKLGASDVSGQLEHIDLYSELLRKRLADAEGTLEKNAKLYRTLGFFAGAAAVIFIM